MSGSFPRGAFLLDEKTGRVERVTVSQPLYAEYVEKCLWVKLEGRNGHYRLGTEVFETKDEAKAYGLKKCDALDKRIATALQQAAMCRKALEQL